MSTGSGPRSFLDTEILICGDDAAHPGKQSKAIELITGHRSRRTGVISLQVLQEYFVTVTRRLKLDAAIARDQVEYYSGFELAIPAASDILAAIDIQRLYNFSYWEALALRMAKQTGCRAILSENMRHGRIIDGVEIVNPFL